MFLTLFYFSHKLLMRFCFCFIIPIRVNNHTLKKTETKLCFGLSTFDGYYTIIAVFGVNKMIKPPEKYNIHQHEGE